MPEYRLPAGHGRLGRRAAARTAVDDRAPRGRAPRVLLRLSQRRSRADVSQFAAGRPRAGGPLRSAAGDSLLQAQRPMADQRARRAGANRRARSLRLQVDQVADARRVRPRCHTRTTPTPNRATTSTARSRPFAATLSVPREAKAGEPMPISGYAQVGVSGLSKVQLFIEPESTAEGASGTNFASAAWRDADILPPPDSWDGFPDGKLPLPTHGFDPATGQPSTWPMRLAAVHWAAMHPPLAAGKYTLRTRTINAQGNAQPMPRPFRKSGHSTIERVAITVTSPPLGPNRSAAAARRGRPAATANRRACWHLPRRARRLRA